MCSNLTSHLLDLSPSEYRAATQHPFLAVAATGTLPKEPLLQWLLQDRHYALTYITFIGALLSKITVPTTSDRTETLIWNITETLIFSLTNIKAELELFDKVLKEEFNWTSAVEIDVLPITRAYKDLFSSSSSSKASLLEGMTVLWATERCYYDAWGFAKSSVNARDISAGGDVMTRVFIPNWTSEAFEEFVDTLEGLVNKLAKSEGVETGGEMLKRCEEVWRQVLWLEERFWPDI